jgi:NAD(P)H-nitrite reductase large subunit
MTTGVRPAITLAQASGIPCARGIVVDGQLRSAVAGVSASVNAVKLPDKPGAGGPLFAAGGDSRCASARHA